LADSFAVGQRLLTISKTYQKRKIFPKFRIVWMKCSLAGILHQIIIFFIWVRIYY
jgi:hypothetical protein